MKQQRKPLQRKKQPRGKLSAIVAAVVLVSMPVYAGLRVIDTKPAEQPSETQPVDERARLQAENQRLQAEIARLTAELHRVKSELEDIRKCGAPCDKRMTRVNKVLDEIERRMEEVGTAIARVNFEFGNTQFTPDAETAEALIAAGKKASKVNVRGHADNVGSAEVNRTVALQRALAAKKFLLDNGVSKNKVRALSRGSEDPVGDNATDEGRAKNRRVEIEFVR